MRAVTSPPPAARAGAVGGCPRLLSGWGRATRSRALVVRPRDEAEVAAALARAGARGVLARGLGRAYGDAAQNAGGTVLDMTGLAGVLALDAVSGEVTALGGTSLQTVATAVMPHGWFPTVVPGTRYVTVGGAIAADIHGKDHHRDGGFTRHVRALTLATPDGALRELAPGDGAFAATAGGMGLTGAVVRATLALRRLPSGLIREEISRAEDLDDLLARMAADDDAHTYSVAWVDAAARGRRLGRALLMRGEHAHADEAAAARDGGRSEAPPGLTAPALRAPRAAPTGMLGPATVAAFNALWLRLKPRAARHGLTPLAGFFWPLDGVRGWNRLYGSRGLIQYQCVVPPGAERVLRDILDRLRRAGAVSPLVVLKRLGDGEAPLAFPMRGWTLALDLAAAAAPARLLDELDAHVAGAGGRVYLAKDARMRPDALRAMYPRLDEWRAARAELDPRGVLRSDLARRLELA